MQILFAVVPTVDTRHLGALPEQHGWGQLALQPLPVVLNAGQSVTSGAHGLELRGTPAGAGQHTLEMETKIRRR